MRVSIVITVAFFLAAMPLSLAISRGIASDTAREDHIINPNFNNGVIDPNFNNSENSGIVVLPSELLVALIDKFDKGVRQLECRVQELERKVQGMQTTINRLCAATKLEKGSRRDEMRTVPKPNG